jgi:hypothetical protein
MDSRPTYGLVYKEKIYNKTYLMIMYQSLLYWNNTGGNEMGNECLRK